MRIGIDCRMYSSRFTGIGRYVYELVRHLSALDPKNDYVLFFNEPEFSLFKEPNSRFTKVLVNAKHYSLREQTTFLKVLNRAKLDVMHFTHFNAPIFYKRPSVVTIHDLTLSFFPGKKMTSVFHRTGYYHVIKSAVKKAKKVIAVSENTKKDLQHLLHTPSSKIEVIYEGVDEKFRSMVSEAENSGRPKGAEEGKLLNNTSLIEKVIKKYGIKQPYLLYTGVWRSHKNLPNLLKTFYLLKNEYNFGGELVITGRKDPVYEPEITSLIQKLNLQKEVILTGMVDEEDLVPLYNGAKIYVFPSLYEGFGLSPLEAMQCGVPVAASNTSCIPEVCGEDNALYFDPQKPEDMAKKINQLLTNPDLRQKLIQNGLQHVKKFSWEKMAKQTLKLYNES